MTTERTQTLTIFEGPDGGGKTTLAKHYAQRIGARYVHFGPLPGVGHDLPRLYAEAMLPALTGDCPVVFDRSWISEAPYATVCRGGYNRVHPVAARLLERLAFRCRAAMVLCLPPLDAVRQSYQSRHAREYVGRVEQLERVYHHYARITSGLPMVRFDYTQHADVSYETRVERLSDEAFEVRDLAHQTHLMTAGPLQAPIAIVSNLPTEVGPKDLLYQWSGASFAPTSDAWALTEHLHLAEDLPERSFLFVHEDHEEEALRTYTGHVVKLVDTLTGPMVEQLCLPGPVGRYRSYTYCASPRRWKNHVDTWPHYPLIPLLRRLLAGLTTEGPSHA